MPKKSTRSPRSARTNRTKKRTASRSSTAARPVRHQSSGMGGWLLFLVAVILGLWVWYAFLGGRDFVRMYLPATQGQVLVGRFRGDLPAADSAGRTLTLENKADGTTTFTQDYHNDEPAIVETGHWEPDKEQTLVVRLDKRNGEPLTMAVPMIFVYHPESAGSLELVQYDPRDWGTNGLQLQRLDPLLGTWTWRDTTLSSGEQMMTDEKQSFSLKFAEDGSVSVTTDCNNGGGSYQMVGLDGLNFGALFSTRMFCAGSQETEFFRQVEQVQASHLDGNTLRLTLQNDSGAMVFEKK